MRAKLQMHLLNYLPIFECVLQFTIATLYPFDPLDRAQSWHKRLTIKCLVLNWQSWPNLSKRISLRVHLNTFEKYLLRYIYAWLNFFQTFHSFSFCRISYSTLSICYTASSAITVCAAALWPKWNSVSFVHSWSVCFCIRFGCHFRDRNRFAFTVLIEISYQEEEKTFSLFLTHSLSHSSDWNTYWPFGVSVYIEICSGRALLGKCQLFLDCRDLGSLSSSFFRREETLQMRQFPICF